MSENKDKVKKLYDTFVSEGYEMESEENFRKNLSYTNKRKAAYDALVKDGYEMEPFEEFENNIGFGKSTLVRTQQVTPNINAIGQTGPRQTTQAVQPTTKKQPQTVDGEDGYNLPTVEEMMDGRSGVFTPIFESETLMDDKGNTLARPVLTPAFDPEEGGVTAPPVYRDVLFGGEYDPAKSETKEYVKRNTVMSTVDYPKQNREQVALLSLTIDRQLEDAYKRAQDEHSDAKPIFVQQMLHDLADGSNTGLKQTDDAYQTLVKNDTDVRALHAAKNSLKNARQMIDEADKSVKEGDYGFFNKGIARGFGNKFFDARTWDMGLSDAQDNGATLTALAIADKGGELTPAQQTLLDAKAVELATNAYFSSSLGRGYKAGGVTAESIPFMIEMCINPASGAGSSAQSMLTRYALRRFGKEVVKKNAKKYVAGKIATRVTGDVVGSAVMSATTGAVRTMADAEERASGQVLSDSDENGNSFFAGHTEGDGMGVALSKAFVNTTIENHSEMVGEYFAPVLKPVFNATGKGVRKGLEKIGADKVSKFIDDVSASDVAKLVTDFEKHSKWNGTIGEYAEEVVGGIENALLVGDQTLDADKNTGVFNIDNNIDTFLGVALMGGFISGIKTLGYRTPKYRAKKDMTKKADEAATLFGNQEIWGDIRNTLAFGNEEDVKSRLGEVLNNQNYNEEQKRAVLDYAKSVEIYKGMLKGEGKRRTEGDEDPVQVDAETSFDNGYSLEDSQEMNDAKSMLDFQRQQMRDAFGILDGEEDIILGNNPVETITGMRETHSDEQIQKAIDYLNAKATYDGMIQNVQDNIESRINASDLMIDSHSNKADGMIHPATMKLNDRKVYIVGGNVVMNEDGTGIDHGKSDESIVLRDAETGNIEFADPTSILQLDEPIDAAQEKEIAQEQIRQQYAQEAANKIDGVLPFNDRDEYTILGDGGETKVTVYNSYVDVKGEVLPVPDGMIIMSYDGGKTGTLVSKESIQQAVDACNLMRLQQFEQEKALAKVEEKQQEAESSRPEYNINDELILRDAEGNLIKGSVVSSENEDGLIEVYTENPINGKMVNMFTRDELDILANTDSSVQETSILGTNSADINSNLEENVPQQPELEPMPMIGEGEDAEPDYTKVSPQRSHKYIYEESGLPKQVANDLVKNNIESVRKEQEKLKKSEPKMGTSIAKYRKELAEWQKKASDAQGRADFWNAVKAEQDKIVALENAEREAANAAARDKAIIEEQKRQEDVLRKKAEQEQIGINNVAPSIREKWNAAPKIDGTKNEIVLPNGEKITGHYVLAESGAASPSHNANAEFIKTDGFPVDANGQSVNDRDYERDIDAQQITRGIAGNYDSRAMQTPVVVSNDGIVLSGNGRTMAGELAASQNTDNAYLEHLKKYGKQYGFTEEQVAGMQHPRVLFVPDEDMPYTADTFAKFNQQDMKGQSKTEHAVKMGKIVDDTTYNKIVRTMNQYDTLGDFYADTQAAVGAIKELANAGVISSAQMSEMFDGENVSSHGKELLENMLIGKAFESNPDVVRMITEYPAMRQAIITALSEISNNKLLGEDYSLESELSQAIELVYNARKGGIKNGELVSAYARQGNLFEFDDGATVADYTNVTMMMLADTLNDTRITRLKKILSIYNNEAKDNAMGQMDMFAGGIESRENILKDVLKLINYGTEEEQQAAINKSVEQRKTESIQQNGIDGYGNDEGTETTEAQKIAESIAKAELDTDTNPTEAQKEAGNYKKGHLKLDGYDITIENPKGSIRSGVDRNGQKWSIEMNNTYGYIRGTEGIDGDHIDVFLSDKPTEGYVYVIDQVNEDGTFDEHKVMYGFNSALSAKRAYLSNYAKGWKGLGKITMVSKDEFKKWIDSSHRKTKPFAEYKSVNVENVQSGNFSQTTTSSDKENNKGKTESKESLLGNYGGMDDINTVMNAIGKTFERDGGKETMTVKSYDNKHRMVTVDLNTNDVGVDSYRMSISEAAEALHNGRWEERQQADGKQTENRMEKNTLSVDDINNSDVEQELKDGALAYINGDVNFVTQIAYQSVYNNVRDRTGNSERDSESSVPTQLGETADGDRGRTGSGRGGRKSDQLDKEGSAATVSGNEERGQNSLPHVVESSGERGDKQIHKSASRTKRGITGDTGRGRGGSNRSDGHNVRTRGGDKVGKTNASNDGGWRTETDRERDSIADEINQLLNDWKKAGNDGTLSMTLIPSMNAERVKVLSKLIVAGARYGFTYLKDGVTNFKDWSSKIREMLAAPLSNVIGLTDAQIDDFITDMWNYPHTIDGRTMKLSQWADELSGKELRKQIQMSLEEKKQLQDDAEPVKVKLRDKRNIEETLPYLLPQQQEDVLRAETQFFDESHADRDHANGKGYMFTNGTGTGKTYTGLGIIKRFIKQGKGRVLVLTPSKTKVDDWCKDAMNLNINLVSLDKWADDRGTTATTEAGEGAVITTYANFRQNRALLESEFDLIVYDESHRLLENKNGEVTAGAQQHYMISNRNEREAMNRYREISPVFKAYRDAEEKLSMEKESLLLLRKNGGDNEIEHEEEKHVARIKEAEKKAYEAKKAWEKEEERLRPIAEEAAKRTKVVFLSATPFNTRENLEYVEGYIFSYPNEENASIGSYKHKSPRTEFYLQQFGAGYKFRYGRLENSSNNSEAVARQEVQFSDYLQNELQTMSGRIIDSEYDYSRDFPTVSLDMSDEMNDAMQSIYKDEALRPLGNAMRSVWGDYNYSSALFETMKVAAMMPRIKSHLDAGRKLVIFHRRVETTQPIQPPYHLMLAIARQEVLNTTNEKEKKALSDAISLFEEKYNNLLKWEMTLDYSMPRVQIAKALGAENVLFFSGKESSKVKNKAVDTFNDDDSGKNVIVIQEASGKEGISLHDRTGKHQRVCITLALPQSPITALQIEGRIYRIGNKSNAIFEYPLLGLDSEMILFGQQFNSQVSTTENLALGSMARNLRESFARGVEEHSGEVPLENQGIGGKVLDKPFEEERDAFDGAVLDYYGNQKLSGRRNGREGEDYFPTPEPLGFMMTEWAQLTEGETVLEPSAGHGAIARYVPRVNGLTAVEPSNSLFSKLQIKAGGNGRKFVNDIFENYNVVNKHDAVLMNPPFGTAGRMAIDHVAKAFQHLEEGGRLIAIIPRGSTDSKFDKWYEEAKNAVMVGEVQMPDVLFERAGTKVRCRVVVIDKVSNKKLAMNASIRLVHVDLSRHDKIEDFFEELRDVEMPERTIDTNGIMAKKAKKAAKELEELKVVKSVDVDDVSINVKTKSYRDSYYFNWAGNNGVPLSKEEIKGRIVKEYAILMRSYRDEEVKINIKDMLVGMSGMTEDELERYGTLNDESGVTVETGVVAASSAGTGSVYTYEQGTHSKTGETLYLAKPNGRITSEQYAEMKSKANKLGGYWSSFVKGFIFPSEETAKGFVDGAIIKEDALYRDGGNTLEEANRKFNEDEKGRRKFAEREHRRMTGKVETLAKRLGVEIEVLQSADDLAGKKRRAKGFFNKNTRKITVIVGNHSSVEDVEKTVLHEAVAHYGLRALFGEHFNDFLNNVFRNAEEGIRKQITAMAAKNGWDFRTATEEYLAGLAENTNFERAFYSNWFGEVKRYFLKMLRQLGFELNDVTLTDNELRYVLWRSYENLAEPGRYRSILGEAADVAMQNALKVGNYEEKEQRSDMVADSFEDGLLFRDDTDPINRVFVRKDYEKEIASNLYQFQEAMQDSMLGLKTLMDKIEKATGRKVADFEDAYVAENAMSSKNRAEADVYKNLLMKPLLSTIATLESKGASQADITDYMMAKHGLERNEVMANHDAQTAFDEYQKNTSNGKKSLQDFINECRKRDYSGLTALTETDDVATAETVAQQMVDDFEDSYLTDTLWDRINACTKATLSKLYESGIISKDVYEKTRDMYEYYIPLRGWDEKTSDEVYGYLTDKSGPMNGSIMKKAEGRTSKADDPIATIAAMAESGISQGNRNLMKQRFLNFVLNNPSDAVSVNNLWLRHDDANDSWEPVFADLNENDTADEVERKVRDFEDKMEQLAEQDPKNYKHGRDAVGIPYIVKNQNMREHQVMVKRNGMTYVLTINGSPRAAQALNGLSNPDVDIKGFVGNILKVGEYVNRQMSAFYTTRNPNFVASNFIRDALYANSTVWVKERPNYAIRYHKNFGKVNPVKLKILLAKHTKGTLDMNDPVEKMFYQFMMNGGETGYTVQRDIEKHKKAIKKEVAIMGDKIPVREALRVLGEQFDDWNRAVENCARFAAFMTSRQMGRSIDRSVHDAKEISVNFNKKGSGSKFLDAEGQTRMGNWAARISGGGRIGYVFWNAAIQGTYNTGKAIKQHPRKGLAMLAATFLLGALIPALAGDGDGDDNKNYYNLPDFVRRSNICFRIDDKWVTIPMPVEMRAMYGLGELATSVMSGNEKLSGEEIAKKIAEQISQMLPLDFMEGDGGFSALTPSSVKPAWEAYVNKDWTGLPLYKKDTEFNKNMPEWTKAYSRTSSLMVKLSELSNRVSGGDKYTKGWADWNPAIVEHLLEGVFGGVTTTINQMVKTVETATGEREFDWRNIPIASRVVKNADERTQMRNVNEKYFKYVDEFNKTKQRMAGYEREVDSGAMEYAEKIDFLNNSPEFRRYEIMEDYISDINSLNTDIKEAESDEERKGYQDEQNALKKEMIEAIKQSDEVVNR